MYSLLPGFGPLKKLWSTGLHLNLGHNFFSLLLKTAKICGFSFLNEVPLC